MTSLRNPEWRKALRDGALVVGLVLLGACGEASPPVAPVPAVAPEVPAPQPQPVQPAAPVFAAFPCPPPSADDARERTEIAFRAAALQPAFEADYLSVRRDDKPPQAMAERGSACAGAADAAACTRALEQLEKQFAKSAPKCEQLDCAGAVYVLTTRAGEPRLWSKPEEVRELLGAIDTAAEAWLVAQVALGAMPYLCGDADVSAQQATPAGFELRERRYTKRCKPAELSELVYRVASDGVAQAVSRTVVQSDPTACMSDEGVVQQ